MANAIAAQAKASGKPPLLLSLCEWGNVRPTSSPRAFVTHVILGATMALG